MTDQLDLISELEAHARTTDPETSLEAAASLTSDTIRASQAQVLVLLTVGGALTDGELVDLAARHGIRQSPSGLRTRRAELVEQGRVAWAEGQWRRTPSGRSARVWRVVP